MEMPLSMGALQHSEILISFFSIYSSWSDLADRWLCSSELYLFRKYKKKETLGQTLFELMSDFQMMATSFNQADNETRTKTGTLARKFLSLW